MTFFSNRRRIAAPQNPTMGDSSSASPTLLACSQSTPLVAAGPPISSWDRPTPMIEPMSVCELDTGSPKYQLPRFHIMAEISSANTMEKPAFDPTCRINSTGSSETIPNATAPLETSTPRKFHRPDQITATSGG